jgi:hypothetical protein
LTTGRRPEPTPLIPTTNAPASCSCHSIHCLNVISGFPADPTFCHPVNRVTTIDDPTTSRAIDHGSRVGRNHLVLRRPRQRPSSGGEQTSTDQNIGRLQRFPSANPDDASDYSSHGVHIFEHVVYDGGPRSDSHTIRRRTPPRPTCSDLACGCTDSATCRFISIGRKVRWQLGCMHN